MSERSAIEWTDSTWNPVTGCTPVSPGCAHCYARGFAERFRGVPGHPYEQGFDLRLWPDRLRLPLRWRKPRRVFVNSMGDLFHEGVPDSFIDAIFETMIAARQHEFQVLTKRPRRMASYLGWRNGPQGSFAAENPHIWLGATVETQQYLWRAKLVAGLPAGVRFVSCEPLLGPLDLRPVLDPRAGINWVIVGGESGPRTRAMEPEWVRDIRDQCRDAGVPFLFKQWGGTNKKLAGRLLDGEVWDQYPRPWGASRPVAASEQGLFPGLPRA